MTNEDYNASIEPGGGLSIELYKRSPKVTCMANVEPREVTWLWKNRIPLGRITLLAGMPGQGKSFLTCDMAARVTRGADFPDGSPCEAGAVLFIACEDDPADTIRPRLDAHNADPSKVHLLESIELKTKGESKDVFFTLDDVDSLEEAIESLPSLRLVIIDPIGSYIGTTANSNTDNEVRAVLAPVAELAKRHNVAIVIVAHTRKSQAQNADDMVMGSRAFTGMARAVWHLMPDREMQDKRLFLAGKSNLSESNEGLSFQISGRPAAIDWNDEPETRTANEALAELYATDRKPTATELAAEWLSQFLGERQVVKQEVMDTGKELGHSQNSINAAAGRLGVVRKPLEAGGKWFWWIPVSSSTDPVCEEGGNTDGHCGILDESGAVSASIDQSDPVSEPQETQPDDTVEGEL